ncbi:hypothetical protein [Erythrobacter ani]|uniref:Nucleotidyltransferase family protein n=1 Tax=Erythrobacter ani TaxID=2827235 RepID=A0ABS6SNP1_9SPHN|nr:hypothetical protein [Erythrobacter ani]MBV7266645.1 hypothetical protein [Erythrobacter ani]
MIEAALRSTLVKLAAVMSSADEPWWIIGSAAVALHGADAGDINDVDVLLAKGDLERLKRELRLADRRDPSKVKFRSSAFGLWSHPALPVEFMADLEVKTGRRWVQVLPQTRQEVVIDSHALYVPEKAELITILRRFDREKDIARAAALNG